MDRDVADETIGKPTLRTVLETVTNFVIVCTIREKSDGRQDIPGLDPLLAAKWRAVTEAAERLDMACPARSCVRPRRVPSPRD